MTESTPAADGGRPQHDVASADGNAEVPRPADGIELIGEYEDSGFKEPPYIARRADGQVIQMPKLLYMVAESIDGRRNLAEIADDVTQRFGRGLEADMIRQLVDEQLRPLGVVAGENGATPELAKADPLLALKMRTGVVPEGVVNALTVVFRPLFWPPVVLVVLAAFFALDAWLFAVHGVAQSLRQTLYDPAFILMLLGLVILSAAFHECGHATACRYGGARPGVMGVGIYIVWPAFYTDVTDAYRLGKAGRLRTDLGGVYFNSIFTLGTFAAYFLTGWEPLLLIVPLQVMEILHQFLPFLRLDGYYIVSDLTGVPDMFARIKPTLASLLPWRETPDEVKVLKPWVRVATTIYVLTFVPLMVFFLGLTVFNVPRIFATAWDSWFVQLHKLGEGSPVHVAVAVIQMCVLALPVVGIVYTLWKLWAKVLVTGWRRTSGRPMLRGAFTVAMAALTAGVGWTWIPNGEYRPIQPGERGTIQGAVREFAAVGSGRPGLTKRRQDELGGAPSQSAPDRTQREKPGTPAGTTDTTTTTTTTTTPTDTTETDTATETGVTRTTSTETVSTAPTETTITETTPTEPTTTQPTTTGVTTP